MFSEIARRGLAHPNTAAFIKRAVRFEGAEQRDRVEVSLLGGTLFTLTFWASMFAMYLVSYMLQELIATLCMVESPASVITVTPSTAEPGDKDEKEGLLEYGPTISIVNQKPITSSIRGTIRHVVAHGGRFARFRGLRLYTLYVMLFTVVSALMAAAVPRFPGKPLFIAGTTGAILANLHATWTHKVVSMPNNKSLPTRFRAASRFKTLALPAAIDAMMPYISLYLTCGVSMLLGLHKLNEKEIANYSSGQALWLLARIISVLVFMVVCSLFLCLPAGVTLVRIEASILPEDEDTIVPFDRSFGGKVVPQIHGGDGKVDFLDAWRSFNWEARRRLIKLFVKSTLLILGLMLVIVHVLCAELFIILGPSLGKFLNQFPAAMQETLST